MEFEKVKNPDTIWQPCHNFRCRMHGWSWRRIVTHFGKTWHDLWIRFVYLGSYTMNRDTILAIVTRFW